MAPKAASKQQRRRSGQVQAAADAAAASVDAALDQADQPLANDSPMGFDTTIPGNDNYYASIQTAYNIVKATLPHVILDVHCTIWRSTGHSFIKNDSCMVS